MRETLTSRERQLADEIEQHDWAAAPYHAIGAAHPAPSAGPRLSEHEAERVRVNVMWVVAQCLGYDDPDFNPDAFAVACGVTREYRCTPFGGPSTIVHEGLRIHRDGSYARPGTGTHRPPA